MTPLWPPARWVAEAVAVHGWPLPGGPVPWERAAGEQAQWVSALPLRLSRGDRDGAAAGARLLAGALADRPGVAVATPTDAGHVLLTLADDALVGLTRAVPRDWATGVGVSAAPPPAVRRRRRGDPVHDGLLAHARLCRTLRGDHEPGGSAYGRTEVLVQGADALRVHDRLATDGRPHHLMDWIARTASAVVTWSDDSAPAGGLPDPRTAAALRDALADALRAVGVTPTERF